MAFTARTETYFDVASLSTPYDATVNKPTGTVEGDILFAVIDHWCSTPRFIDSVPSGWTLLGEYISDVDRYHLYYKIAGASEPSSYTWSFDNTCWTHIVCSCYTGSFNTSDPIDVVSNTAYRVRDANVIAASMAVSAVNSPLVFWANNFSRGSVKSFTKPSAPTTDWIEDYDAGSSVSNFSTEVCSMVWSGSGATGDMIAVLSADTNDSKHAFAVALNPAGGGETYTKTVDINTLLKAQDYVAASIDVSLKTEDYATVDALFKETTSSTASLDILLENLVTRSTDDDIGVYYDSDVPSWVKSLASEDIDVGFEGYNISAHGFGLHFSNITIPKGSTISSAYIVLTPNASRFSNVVNGRITGNLTPDAAVWSTLQNYQDRRGTVVGGANDNYITSAQVDWDDIEDTHMGVPVTTPDIKTIIQEVIDQEDWESGNNIAIWVDDHDDRSDHELTRYRIFAGIADTLWPEAKIQITYEISAAFTYTKTVSINSLLKSQDYATASISSLLKSIDTSVIGLDTLLKVSGITSINLLLESLGIETISLDTLVRGLNTKYITVDLLLRALGIKETVEIDSLLVSVGLESANIDTLLRSISTTPIPIDAILSGIGINGISIDMLIKILGLEAIDLDTVLVYIGSETISLNTLLRSVETKTIALSALVGATNIQEVNLSTLIKALSAAEITDIDMLINTTQTKTINVDVLLEALGVKTLDIDTLLKSVDVKTTSISTLLKGYSLNQVNLSALLKKIEVKQLDLGALLKSTDTQLINLNSLLRGIDLNDIDLDILVGYTEQYYALIILDAIIGAYYDQLSFKSIRFIENDYDLTFVRDF